MSLRVFIAGLGLAALLVGCAPAVQTASNTSPKTSAMEQWITSYRAKYGCVGVVKEKDNDFIEMDAKTDYVEKCGDGKFVDFKTLRVVKRRNAGYVTAIAFRYSQE